MKSLTSSTMLILALLGGHAFAADDSGWYLGGNLGQSQANIDDDRIIDSLATSGFTTTALDDDERDLGYKVFGGYKLLPWFAIEGGYFDLGEFDFSATTVSAGTLSGSLKTRGLNIDPVFILPITQRFSAFGRAGLTYAQTRSTYASSGAVTTPPSSDEREMGYKFGAGVQYDITERLGLRLEAERYQVDEGAAKRGGLDLFSAGLIYRFYGSRTAAPAPAAATKPAPKPTPAPVLVVVPVSVRTQQYCSILDIQFEINQDEIQREELERLGVVGTFLKKYPDTTAVIEGHSDNIGAADHNLKLSQRRAESVVTYLTDTFAIASPRLQAIGYGDTRPLASNDTEIGKRLNRRIGAVIACATDIAGLKIAPSRVTVALEMEFPIDRAEIKPQYHAELNKVADFLNANPSVTATVEGHTSNRQGSADQALVLSQQRAQSVVNYLADTLGIARSRLTAEGFGETRRYAYNTSAEGQQDNRRVNIIINYPR